MLAALGLTFLLAAPQAAGSYVGSARCGSCHKKQHEVWAKDWHGRALAAATRATVEGRFEPPYAFDRGSTRAETSRRGESFVMRAPDRAGVARDFAVAFTVGGRRMQDYLTPFPDGRLQVLPIYWHVTGRGEWVDLTTLKQGALDREHPFFWTNYARTFNKECLTCHVTGESIGWDEASGTFRTAWAEPGVACEACHGPGARHARDGLARSIVRPTGLSPERGAAICAACHAPRAPWRSAFGAAARFRPGQLFEDVFEPLTPILGPGDLSGDFWIDGRPSAGSFESAALGQSACARRGGVTCFTCHTPPHGSGGLSELKPAARTDEVCLGCHRAFAAPAAAQAHGFHPAGKAGCVACHMPRTVTGVLDPQADHSIDVPNPENRRDFGIPDACGTCHPRKPAEWAIAELEKRFPGSTRRERRRRLARALNLWLARDPAAEPAFVALLSDGAESALMRANAAMALGSTPSPGPEGSAALVRALDDPSAAVAARAARALGTRRDRSAAEALDRACRGSRDPVALSACLALLDLGDRRGPGGVDLLLRRPGLAGDYRLETARAILEQRAGATTAARRHLERAIVDRPDFVPARLRLASLLKAEGQGGKAKTQEDLGALFRH